MHQTAQVMDLGMHSVPLLSLGQATQCFVPVLPICGLRSPLQVVRFCLFRVRWSRQVGSMSWPLVNFEPWLIEHCSLTDEREWLCVVVPLVGALLVENCIVEIARC